MKLRILLLIGLLACGSNSLDSEPKINGLCLVAPSFDIGPEHYQPIQSVGANWVAIIPYAFCSPERPTVVYDHPNQWIGEKTEGVRKAIKLAQHAGLKVMLKPHIWVLGQGWAGDLRFETDEDTKTWQKSYSDYILHFTRLAEELGVEMIAIGTEIRHLATSDTDYWMNLISQIRSVYKGKITYAANWDNYQNIGFWKYLDYIGIDAYFPSSNARTPQISSLLSENDSVKTNLKNFSESFLKKVLFTEFGFRSIDYCTTGHWKVEEKIQNINVIGQANAYEAFFKTYWKEDWIVGGFAWKWHYDHQTAGGSGNKQFTPQNKLAEKILRTRYTNSQK